MQNIILEKQYDMIGNEYIILEFVEHSLNNR